MKGVAPSPNLRFVLPFSLGAMVTIAAAGGEAPAEESVKDLSWCDWLRDDPGEVFKDKGNPWIQAIEIGGRFQYQAAYVDGNDVNGREFHDAYDEYRRVRLESKVDFLRFFRARVDVSIVDDGRFRDEPGADLSWGYDSFNEASLEFDIDDALGGSWFDDAKVIYGRTRLRMTQEGHDSSREILTVERSGISDRLGGGMGRPTGVLLELGKNEFELHLGLFSGEDDADFIGGWSDGCFYYASLEWSPDKEWTLLWDHAWNDQEGTDDFLQYAWASALSVRYEQDRWGVLGEIAYGENGGPPGVSDPERQGGFKALVLMPWFWIVEDRLQAVAQYQFGSADHEQGLQLPSRYVRGRHDDPLVDVDNGRGSGHQALYLGLNYYFCGDNLKVMGGVNFDDLETKKDDVEAVSYLFGLRGSF